MDWLAFAIYIMFHSVAVIILLLQFSCVSERAVSFFSDCFESAVCDDLTAARILRPFSTPLTTQHPLYSLASWTSATQPGSLCNHPPFAHRRDSGIFFHPRVCPFLDIPLPFSFLRWMSSISCNLAFLRNLPTPIASEDEEEQWTKLHQNQSCTRSVCICIYCKSLIRELQWKYYYFLNYDI